MKQNRLNLYLIDMKYIRNLAKADDHVMSVSPQISKENVLLLASSLSVGLRNTAYP